jgi:hypothetical protein
MCHLPSSSHANIPAGWHGRPYTRTVASSRSANGTSTSPLSILTTMPPHCPSIKFTGSLARAMIHLNSRLERFVSGRCLLGTIPPPQLAVYLTVRSVERTRGSGMRASAGDGVQPPRRWFRLRLPPANPVTFCCFCSKICSDTALGVMYGIGGWTWHVLWEELHLPGLSSADTC